MKKLIPIALCSLMLLAPRPAAAKVKIVCTIGDLCDIAANVGGGLDASPAEHQHHARSAHRRFRVSR